MRNKTANRTDAQIAMDARAAADWMARALSSSGYVADFSLNSLKEIDRFFDEQSLKGEPKPGGLLSESFGNRMFSIGAYVGEVICRHSGAQWCGDDNDPEAEINVSVRLNRGGVIWPVQRVLKRLHNGREDGIYAYGAALIDASKPLWKRFIRRVFPG